ncbi:FUN14 domain-containing protein 1 [Halotydeus destructor]|nr:FUN14 domain-containing protein 1 [Halotydeus destructor]
MAISDQLPSVGDIIQTGSLTKKEKKDDPAEWIRKALSDLSKSSATSQVIVGTGGGWVSGFIFAKFGKTAATAAGGTILLLHLAQRYGYVEIDWKRVQKDVDRAKKELEKKAQKEIPKVLERLQQLAIENVLLAGSFSGGFFLGLASA